MELRRGRIRSRWVIIAPERASRPTAPGDSGTDAVVPDVDDCPFCPGRESLTPPEIYRVHGSAGAWRVRVVPNRFPALGGSGEVSHGSGTGLFDHLEGCGAHEVVVETPDHTKQLPDLAVDQIKAVIDTFAARLRALFEDRKHRYVLVFKNHGKEAGASLLHSHSQIIAMPVVPEDVQSVLDAARRYFERERRCLFCDVVRDELRDGRRLVEERDGFVTLTPFGSRLPFELAVHPQEHAHDFSLLAHEQRFGLACVLKRSLQRIRALLGDVPYNLVLQTAPNAAAPPGERRFWEALEHSYHWRIEIVPRTTRTGGLEWGAGVYINTVSPEDAAERLRGIELQG